MERLQTEKNRRNKLKKTIKLAAMRSVGYRTKKRVTTWFNEKCKIAIENRDKAKMEVLKDNSNEKRNVLAQKQREVKKRSETKKEYRKKKNLVE